MQIINGAYANAIVYTDEIEASAAGQIQALCDQPFAAGAKTIHVISASQSHHHRMINT